jgi:hypothetical protein
VLDDHGNIWLDPDGVFQNCVYKPQNDPKNPLFIEGGCDQANVLDGKIRYSVDPDPGIIHWVHISLNKYYKTKIQ